jgi:hypothetical protein
MRVRGLERLRSFRWPLAACIVGGASSVLFSSVLQWPRAQFVAGHAVLVSAFVLAYVRIESVSLRRQFGRRWIAGVIVGAIVGTLLARQVWGQPSSPRPSGAGPLIGALAWYGVLYGAIDAMLLTIIPVLTVYGSRSAAELSTAGARLRMGGFALLASAAVTVGYHLGFAEFRSTALIAPIVGNTVMTMAYLLTGSPLAAVVSHVLMHGAAVLHGMSTTSQLPPHY